MLIERSVPTIIEVLWDEAPDAATAAMEAAERIAAAKREER